MKPGDWVASPDHIGRVKNVHGDGSIDVVIYARSGDRVGRVSPPQGGPTGFEPCCTASNWRLIHKPEFPLMRAAYTHEVVTFLENEECHPQEGKGK